MSSNPSVAAARQDLGYMLSILNIQSNKTTELHAACCLCGDQTAMQFGPEKKRAGEWYWHCNKCRAGGDVVKAICLTHGFTGDDSWKQAYDKIEKDFTGRVSRNPGKSYGSHRTGLAAQGGFNPNGYVPGVIGAIQSFGTAPPNRIQEYEKPEPVLDDRAEDFVAKHHKYLMENLDLLKKYKRGISEEVAKKYRLGFAVQGMVRYPQNERDTEIPAGWVLPITDGEGKLKGVKAHFEERPIWKGKQCAKNLWLPFGIFPAYKKYTNEDGFEVEEKPVHSYYSMWPHPDTLMPAMPDDFCMEPSYWISRIPASIKPEWDDILMAQKYKVAYAKETTPDDMNEEDLWQAHSNAFDEMKPKIFRAVMKQRNAIERAAGPAAGKPETDWKSYTFILGGELKALAAESAGLMATAGTGGESWIPGTKLLSKFTGSKICVVADEDPTKRAMDLKDPTIVKKIVCTGKEWAEKWCKSMADIGADHVILKYGGQREKSRANSSK